MSEEKKTYRIDGRPATIFRVTKNPDNPYVSIDRRPIDNPKLSYKAKGILTYLMSRPDGWEVSVSDMINKANDGEASVRSGLKELKLAGHMKYTKIREKGRITGWLIEVFEVPSPDRDFLDVEKPHVEKPHVENRGQVLKTLSINDLSINEENKKEKEVFLSMKNKDQRNASADYYINASKRASENETWQGIGITVWPGRTPGGELSDEPSESVNLIESTELTGQVLSSKESSGLDSNKNNKNNKNNKKKLDLFDGILESAKQGQIIQEATNAFESIFGFGSLNWDAKPDWRKFALWITGIYQSDPDRLRDYVKWRMGDGKFHAMNNNKIREKPLMFMDTGWPTFLAHTAMYSKDALTEEYPTLTTI